MMTIAVTGPDASGKDTQVELLARHFKSLGLKTSVTSIWSALRLFNGTASPETIHVVLQTFLTEFAPVPRSLFLQSVLQQSMSEAEPDSDVLIMNGFVTKYWASEKAYGVDDSVWEGPARHLFRRPEAILVLECPLETCLSRRTKWTPYERGEAQFAHSPVESLREFQTRLHRVFPEVIDRCTALFQPPAGVHRIAGDGEPDRISRQVVKSLRDFTALAMQDRLARGLSL